MSDPPAERSPDGAPPAGRPIRWGLGDVAIGFLAGELLSVVVYLLAMSVTDYRVSGPSGTGAAFGQVVGHLATGSEPAYQAAMPLWLQAIVQIPLWACLLGVPIVATIVKGNGPVRDLGLRMRPIDVPVGLAIGVASQLVLVPLIYWPIQLLLGEQDVSEVARQLTDRATDPFSVVMLFVIVGIGAPIAEEIFFRGLTQRSLDRRWGPWVALIGTAAFFAATHFELLQFPALFAFGLLLGAMVYVTGRLGTSIWAHLGFNLVAAATLVWNLEPTAPGLVAAGALGLVACAYLVATYRRHAEKPMAVTAP